MNDWVYVINENPHVPPSSANGAELFMATVIPKVVKPRSFVIKPPSDRRNEFMVSESARSFRRFFHDVRSLIANKYPVLGRGEDRWR